MKKLSIIFLIALSSSLILGGCGKKGDTPSTTEMVDASDIGINDYTPEDTEIIPVESEPERGPEGSVRSQLTNQWIDESLANIRPIAVMIPTDSVALPHYNISNASILYEAMVEGNITRFMAVIEDWQNLEKIGNVRSMRDYYVYWAFEWDPIICHFGNPYYADEVLGRAETNNLDGTYAANAYFRAKDRKAPHNAYASGEGILKDIEKYGYSLEHTSNFRAGHFLFADASNPNTLEDAKGAFNATTLNFAKCYPVDKPYFVYNEDDGLYYRFQYGEAHVDAATGQQLAFTNVLVQNTYWETRDAKGYLYLTVHDNTRDGYFFTNGKGIHVTWKKTNNFDATKFYDDNGNEIVLNTGKTMICVVQEGKSFTYE